MQMFYQLLHQRDKYINTAAILNPYYIILKSIILYEYMLCLSVDFIVLLMTDCDDMCQKTLTGSIAKLRDQG